jgi:hypothetical protein
VRVERALNISSVGKAKRQFREGEPKSISMDSDCWGERGMILFAISDGASVPVYFDISGFFPPEAYEFDDWIAVKPKDVITALGKLA